VKLSLAEHTKPIIADLTDIGYGNKYLDLYHAPTSKFIFSSNRKELS
jgi:hypothetical protein